MILKPDFRSLNVLHCSGEKSCNPRCWQCSVPPPHNHLIIAVSLVPGVQSPDWIPLPKQKYHYNLELLVGILIYFKVRQIAYYYSKWAWITIRAVDTFMLSSLIACSLWLRFFVLILFLLINVFFIFHSVCSCRL